MNFSIKISPIVIKILAGILVVLVIAVCAKKINDVIIINKTKDGFETVKNAYAEAVKKENFVWKKGVMKTSLFGTKIAKYLPVKQNCEYDPNHICYPQYINFKNIVDGSDKVHVFDFYKITLKNDMVLLFKVVSPDCSYLRDRCATVFVDINGKKGPNKFGEDIYDFLIQKDQVTLYPKEADHEERCLKGSGLGCADFMFTYGNRNFDKYEKYQKNEIKKELKKLNEKR